jgi:hypothetical protein
MVVMSPRPPDLIASMGRYGWVYTMPSNTNGDNNSVSRVVLRFSPRATAPGRWSIVAGDDVAARDHDLFGRAA